MSKEPCAAAPPELLCEPERCELHEGPAYPFELDRREFFKIAGSGLVVLCLLQDAAAYQPGGRRRGGFGAAGPAELGAWLHIGADNKITVYTGKVEIGQNIRTSLSQTRGEGLR